MPQGTDTPPQDTAHTSPGSEPIVPAATRAAPVLATAVAALLAAALGGAIAYAVHGPHTRPGDPKTYLVYALAWAVFAPAAFLVVRRVPVRAAVPLIVLGAVAFQLVALTAPPQTSDDAYRYAWDGRVQAAGISPYEHAPQDPELRHLRDEWLFPAGTCTGWFHHRLPDGSCTLMNRPAVHTIYPPVAQYWYRAIHFVTPDGAREPVQAASALVAVGVTVALLLILRRFGRDPRYAVVWAWCPMVALESGNNAHIDGLGALLMLCGLAAVASRRPVLGGVLTGAAIAVKMFPAVSLIGAVRRKPLVTAGVAALTAAATYIPYLVMSGPAVFGYLPGYLREERYDDGARFGLLGLVMPERATPYAAAAVLLAAAVLVGRRSDPDRPWSAALTMTGTLLLVLTPNYPWYALLLVALVVLDGRAEWLAVGLAGYGIYFTWSMGLTDQQIRAVHQGSYGLALVVVAAAAAVRAHRRRDRRNVPSTASPVAFSALGPPLTSVQRSSGRPNNDTASSLDA
ncbi:glycosyltransferase 87 family protein [Yinghuangia sp. YIM S10712]|uniref:glycosyltransferase 87 family protein n=1 Tax=Yinghuangia sp. YIM S10712 TaxID=3436930 RepID=UPI003F53E366